MAPKLFEWPPVKSPAQAVERVSILLIVGSILFQIVTGTMNIQYDYPGSAVDGHMSPSAGAFVQVSAL